MRHFESGFKQNNKLKGGIVLLPFPCGDAWPMLAADASLEISEQMSD